MAPIVNYSIFTVRNSSCGKVMFSQASVCPRGERRCTTPGQNHLPARHTPPWKDTPGHTPPGHTLPPPLPDTLSHLATHQLPPGHTLTPPGHPPSPRETPPVQNPTQADDHCSGRYASYWNAFFLYKVHAQNWQIYFHTKEKTSRYYVQSKIHSFITRLKARLHQESASTLRWR